jgi:hypothetical protein
MQEIQEALDERQNNFDSLLANIPLAQPFAFESQIDTDINPINLSLKSTDELLQQSESNISNETVPLLAAPNEKENQNQRWTSKKDLPDIKTEAVTPVRSNSVVSFLNF